MIVGQRILYDNFLEAAQGKKSSNKGRSSDEIAKRNQLMCYRYFYLVFHKKKNYNDAIETLNAEFFITEITIIKILSLQQELLKTIFADKPKTTFLKRKYNWLVWA